MTATKRRLRLGRRLRLLDARDFARVFQRPSKSSGPAITVLARPSGRNHARLGIAIARKEVRRAVQRNRLKRLIRESFRHHQAMLAGLDLVVIARRGLAVKTSQAVFGCLEKHWRRVSEQCARSGPAGGVRGGGEHADADGERR